MLLRGLNIVNIDTSSLYVVDFPDIESAIAAAQTQDKFLQFPPTYTLNSKIDIHNNIKLKGAFGGSVITDNTTKSVTGSMIVLHEGTHIFKDITFKYPQEANLVENYNAIQTAQNGITFHNQFYNCKWVGEWYNNYQSSAAINSISAFYGCNMYAYSENMQHYSQNGPNTIIMWDCIVKTVVSHNLYCHPLNNFDIRRFKSYGCNINSINIYGTADAVINGINSLCYFDDISFDENSVATATGSKGMMRLWSPSALLQVKNSHFAPYEMYAVNCEITNCNLFNAGNGTFVANNAIVTNCTGTVTIRDGATATINNSNIAFGIGLGANVTINNSTIDMLGQSAATCVYNNTTFTPSYDLYNSNGYVNNVTCNSCIFAMTAYGSLRVMLGTYSGFTYNNTTPPTIT